MTSQTLKHAIGIFSNRQDVDQALVELKNKGFPMHKISVITKSSDSDEGLDNLDRQKLSMTRVEGAKAGAIAGSTAIGLLTLVIGLSLLLVPGTGSALAVESLAITVLGSGTAAAIGGLHGALQGWLVPEEQAKIYNERFSRGEYLVVIEATAGEILIAKSILSDWGIWAWRVYDAP